MLMKMYSQLKVHVPEKYLEKIKAAVTQEKPLAVKLNLTKEANATLLLTPGQLLKIKRSKSAGKNVLTVRMSLKQVKHNVQFEGDLELQKLTLPMDRGLYLHLFKLKNTTVYI